MEYLTVREVAGVFHVSPETVRRWVKRGAPNVRMGGPGSGIRFDMLALESWLDKYRQGEWSRA